jgi:hypothetical protein
MSCGYYADVMSQNAVITIPTEITAAAVLISFWDPDVGSHHRLWRLINLVRITFTEKSCWYICRGHVYFNNWNKLDWCSVGFYLPPSVISNLPPMSEQ